MKAEELKVLADLTVALTELRLRECSWLCIENYAPEVFGKLLARYQEPQGAVQIVLDNTASRG